MAHGCESPLVTTLTRILCCSAVSNTQGPSPNGGTGTLIRCCCAWLGVTTMSSSAAAHRKECLTLMRTSLVRQTQTRLNR